MVSFWCCLGLFALKTSWLSQSCIADFVRGEDGDAALDGLNQMLGREFMLAIVAVDRHCL
jgi:hypothetical protein